MRKILIIIIFLIAGVISGQSTVGSTATPYSTDGWASPAEYTQYYNLAVFTLLSNPGGWINKNTAKIDSLLDALVVYTDTSQLSIVTDTLKFATRMSGKGAFTDTASVDTISLAGVGTNDIIVATPVWGGVYNANDVLYVLAGVDEFYVFRNTGGSSALSYNWIWMHK